MHSQVDLQVFPSSSSGEMRDLTEPLSTIVEMSEDAILSISLDGHVASWNHGAARLYGYAPEEMIGHTLERILPESPSSEASDILCRAQRGESVPPVATVHRTRDGREVDVLLTASPLRNRDGNIAGSSIIARDITELRRLERENAERAEQIQLLLASTSVAVCSVDLQGNCTLANRTCATMLGYDSPEKLLGQNLHDCTGHQTAAGEPCDIATCPISAAFASGNSMHSVEQWFRRLNGTAFPVEVWSHPIVRDGGCAGAVVTFIDITERQRLEERFRAAVESARTAMVMADRAGRIVLVNSETERLFGYRRNELLDRHIEILLPKDKQPRHVQLREAYFHNPVPRRLGGSCDLHGRHQDGREFPIELGLSPVETHEGLFVLATMVDLTERQRAENDIREAVRRRDRFLAMLSHELRNPLSAARTAVTLLSTPGVPESALSQAREVLDRQINHMTRLLDDLLDVSRFTQDKLQVRKETVDLVATARDAIAETAVLAQENGSTIEASLSDQPVWVHGDPSRLVQMQANVLANAVKYSRPGGPVSISVLQQDQQAVIQVRDQGVGIPPHMLDRIFDMFVQSDATLDRSRGGMGVGLTLVRSIVALHGGTVIARSEGEGRGSEFEIRLPLTAAAPARAEVNPVARSGLRRRILLVEDQDDTRSMLSNLLTMEGHEVHQAADGHTALKLFAVTQPEIGILDLGLPGFSGIELARHLRQAQNGHPLCLIALTGYGQPEDIAAALEAGFDYHLVKPLNLPHLLKLLESPIETGRSCEKPPPRNRR